MSSSYTVKGGDYATAHAVPVALSCDTCGKLASQLCKRCKSVVYCDRDCQVKSWGRHKPLCVPAPAGCVLPICDDYKEGVGVTPVTASERKEYEDIVALLRARTDDLVLVRSNVSELSNRVRSPAGIQAVFDAGVVPVLFKALRLHSTVSSVVSMYATSLLGLIANLDEGRRAIIAEDGIPLILHAFIAHSTSLQNCQCGFSILTNLCSDRVTLEVLLSERVAFVMVEIIKYHLSTSTAIFNTSACMTLRNLMLSDAGAASAIECGAVAVALSLLRLHETDAALCEAASIVLAILTFRPAGNAAILAVDSAPRLIVSLARKHLAFESVVRALLQLFENIAMTTSGSAALLAAGVLLPLLSSLRRHATSPGICRHAIAVLMGIGSPHVAGGAAALLDAEDCVPLIVASLRSHILSPDVSENACLALSHVAFSSVGCGRLLAVDAISAIVGSFREHLSIKLVCIAAGKALGNIVNTATGVEREALKARALEVGAIPLLVVALATHGTAEVAILQRVLRLFHLTAAGLPL